MNGVFDIAEAIGEKAARFLEETGITPAVCFVSRELYRLLIEQKATAKSLGNLIIASYPVTRILTGTLQISIVIDETLCGEDLNIG